MKRSGWRIAWIAMACAAAAWGRDPFYAPPGARCALQQAAPVGWRLLGVTRRGGEDIAWFHADSGRLIGLAGGAQLGDTPWRIHRISLRGVSLQGLPPCQHGQRWLSLQGVSDEKDGMDRADDRPARRGGAEDFTGI
ncbi:HofP DNA utilization family protein [Pantoea sp. 1.19]|uniref:HofP DNA utilization family protein n=1 Tax=Pantoea sp. 1.19 TaxID=1925589 RepID=UPI0009FA99C2|nr:HofP DNA utilization family protein [Pantoea sp. 1.19]